MSTPNETDDDEIHTADPALQRLHERLDELEQENEQLREDLGAVRREKAKLEDRVAELESADPNNRFEAVNTRIDYLKDLLVGEEILDDHREAREQHGPALDQLVRLNRRLAECDERITTLQQETDVQQSAPQGDKDHRVARLVDFAAGKRDAGQDGAVLTRAEIEAAADVSRRYSYTLIDELPEEYTFIRPAQDAPEWTASKLGSGGKGIYVDCEQAHHTNGRVSKLITRTEDETA